MNAAHQVSLLGHKERWNVDVEGKMEDKSPSTQRFYCSMVLFSIFHSQMGKANQATHKKEAATVTSLFPLQHGHTLLGFLLTLC